MKKKPQARREGRRAGFWLLMAGSTLVTGGLVFFWSLSPLALGFSDWPGDPARRRLILRLYDLSWYWGIPALLVAQALRWFWQSATGASPPGFSPCWQILALRH